MRYILAIVILSLTIGCGSSNDTATSTGTDTTTDTNTSTSFNPNSPACDKSSDYTVTGGAVGVTGLWVVTNTHNSDIWNLVVDSRRGSTLLVNAYAIKASEYDQVYPPSLTYYTKNEFMAKNCTILVPDSKAAGAPTVQGVLTEQDAITDGVITATWSIYNQTRWAYFTTYPSN